MPRGQDIRIVSMESKFLRSERNIDSVNLLDEMVNLWIFTLGLTLSGCFNLTRLASDLGQARHKYHRTVHKYLCTVHI